MHDAGRPMTAFERGLLAVLLTLALVLLLYLLGKFWPQDIMNLGDTTVVPGEEALFWGLVVVPSPPEIRVLVLVLCGGALGGLLHAIRSFTDYAGNRQLVSSWTLWYLSRPVSGALLGLLFYLLLRGGLLPNSMAGGANGTGAISVVGFTGAAGLIGLFSDQAMSKLKEVFDVLFASREGERRKNRLVPREEPQRPVVESLEPGEAVAGAGEVLLTVRGQHLHEQCEVHVDGQALATTAAADGSLQARVDAEQLASPGVLSVTVVDRRPGGATSESSPWPVLAP